MIRRALQGYQKTLGPDHILTLTALYNLGYIFLRQGKLEEAEPMYRRALQGYQTTLGREHHYTRMAIKAIQELKALKGTLF